MAVLRPLQRPRLWQCRRSALRPLLQAPPSGPRHPLHFHRQPPPNQCRPVRRVARSSHPPPTPRIPTLSRHASDQLRRRTLASTCRPPTSRRLHRPLGRRAPHAAHATRKETPTPTCGRLLTHSRSRAIALGVSCAGKIPRPRQARSRRPAHLRQAALHTRSAAYHKCRLPVRASACRLYLQRERHRQVPRRSYHVSTPQERDPLRRHSSPKPLLESILLIM